MQWSKILINKFKSKVCLVVDCTFCEGAGYYDGCNKNHKAAINQA